MVMSDVIMSLKKNIILYSGPLNLFCLVRVLRVVSSLSSEPHPAVIDGSIRVKLYVHAVGGVGIEWPWKRIVLSSSTLAHNLVFSISAAVKEVDYIIAGFPFDLQSEK